MNKYQKIAYKLAKFEDRTGHINWRNNSRKNNKYGFKLKSITLKSTQNTFYNFFKREKMSYEEVIRFKKRFL